MRPDRESFSFWHSVDVRFKDIDVGGHAHHSMVLVYFEEGRARYWQDVVGMEDPNDVDFILAEAKVRYHSRIFYPSRLRVGVRVSTLKRKHFVMEYLLEDQEGEALASGETVMVMYDYERARSKEIAQEVSGAIRKQEGPALD